MMKGQNSRSARFRPIRAISPVLLAVLILVACSPGDDPGLEKPITIGMEATAVNTLIYIAQERNYFADNGLEVVINDGYPSGAAATEQMLAGKADLSTTAELAVVRYALAGRKVQTLGSIDMFMHMKLIGRKDLGIADVTDLAGKRIGVPVKTAADFKLGRFLDLNGIDRNTITIVDVQAPQAVESLVKGSVDAIVTWQPNVMDIQDRLGDKAAVLEVQSGQPMYCVLVTSEKWAAENPGQSDRLMKSLLQAEEYLIRNGDKARDIVQKRLGYNDRHIKTIWPAHQFSLRLEQSLILAMEDQARWMIENELTPERNVPDFLDYVHADGLEAVKPQAVSIIR